MQVGTYAYFAPERVDVLSYTANTDIWSLGEQLPAVGTQTLHCWLHTTRRTTSPTSSNYLFPICFVVVLSVGLCDVT